MAIDQGARDATADTIRLRTAYNETIGAMLRRFREKHGLSLREAARQLHIAHPVLLAWEVGRFAPVHAYRRAIERWTRGEIAADAWAVPAVERETMARASRVRPIKRAAG